METNQTAKERESLESAALRLLGRLEQRAKKGCRTPKGPAQIREIDDAPVDKRAAEMAARVSASLSGQVARLGGLRRDAVVAANDNGRAGLIGFPLRGVMPAATARPYPDDSADQIARIGALLKLHAPSEF